jgi:hypothetical protein
MSAAVARIATVAAPIDCAGEGAPARGGREIEETRPSTPLGSRSTAGTGDRSAAEEDMWDREHFQIHPPRREAEHIDYRQGAGA